MAVIIRLISPLPVHRDWPVSPHHHPGCLALCPPQSYQFPDLETTSCGRYDIALKCFICNTPLFLLEIAWRRCFDRLCCAWDGCQGIPLWVFPFGRLGAETAGRLRRTEKTDKCFPKSHRQQTIYVNYKIINSLKCTRRRRDFFVMRMVV